MTRYCKPILGIAVATAIGLAVGWAQQTTPSPEPGSVLKIEGEVTNVSIMPLQGPPALMLKTTDGTEYVVRFGPIRNLRREGFNPKVGDKVAVTGTICCEIDEMTVIDSSEITIAGKTFRTPLGSSGWQGPRMGPGRRGPMMGPGWQGGCMQGGPAGGPQGCPYYNQGAQGCPYWNR